MEMRDFALNIKSKAPDATDQEIVQLWAAAQQNPRVVDEFIGQKALQRVTTAGKKMNPSESPMDASTRIPAPANLPMQLPSPWAGTTQEKANPVNPAAYTISQFDPRLQREADARFAEMYKNQTGDRLLSGLFAAGAGGLEGVKKSEDMWAEKNKKLFDMMVLSEERARKAATEGLAGATSLQNMAQQAGTFQKDMAGAQLDQEAKRLGLIGTALTAEQQQRLNDPNSIETLSLKAIIPQMLSQPGISPQIAAELRAIAAKPEATAAQLAPIVGQLAPQALDKWVKTVGGKGTEATTAKTVQETRKAAAEADITQAAASALTGKPTAIVSTSDQAARDREALRMKQDEVSRIEAKMKTLDPNSKEYKELDQAKLANMRDMARGLPKGQEKTELEKRIQHATISAAGMTLPPLPEVTAGAQSDAKQMAEFNDRARIYDTQLVPTIQKTKEILAKTDPGLLTNTVAKIWAGDSRELVNMFNRFNTIYPGALGNVVGPEMSRSINQGGFTGSIVANMTGTQVANMIRLIEETAQADREYQKRAYQSTQEGNKPGTYPMNQPVPVTGPEVKKAPPQVPKDWKLMTDKNGNRAYVSPDGKQYIEVK